MLYSFLLGGWFSSFVNPAISKDIDLDALTKWLPTFALFFFAIYIALKNKSVPRSVLWISAFFGWGLLASSFSSESFLISAFKIFSFYAFISSSIIIFSKPGTDWTSERFQFLLDSFYKFLIITSLIALFSGIGYERNGHGFQGITQHPQAFGIVLSPLVVAMIAMNFDELRKANPRIIGWVGIGCLFIIMTESRTAMLSLGLGLVSLIFLFFKNNIKRGFVYTAIFAPVFLAGFSLVQLDESRSARFSEGMEAIVFKGYDAVSLGEGFYLSRGYILDKSFDNISENWLLGIGFGIPSDKDLSGAVYDPLFGLPISLTVEKGVAFIALLEEVGFPGLLLFCFFLISLLRAMRRSVNYFFAIPVFVSILSVNIGEAVLFSMGGVGFFHWLIVSGLLLNDETKSEKL
ncbi:O-antigen ligase family protein [Isoalcanivorax pacificus]|nr:O-antigen ligase family protein [Isoalcanivorax pacificus]